MGMRPPRSLAEFQRLRTLVTWCQQSLKNSVETPDLKDESVTTAKLAPLAVTTAKLATSAVTTIKLADHAVSDDKLRQSAALSVLGRASNTLGDVADIEASSNGTYLGRQADAAGFFAIPIADITGLQGALDAKAAFSTATFTGSLTGCTTVPTGTVRYTKVGNIVALYLPAISGTSNTTAATITGAPAAIQPARAQPLQAIVTDIGVTAFATLQVETSGVITLGVGASLGAFTNVGTKGIPAQTVTYSLD